MRVKPFAANIEVTGQLVREQPEMTERLARKSLTEHLSGVLVGPRGGRYEPFGEIRFAGPSPNPEMFHRDIYWYVARRDARYVRPRS